MKESPGRAGASVAQRRTDPSCLGAGSDYYNARFRRSRHEDLGRPLSWLRANVLQYLFAECIGIAFASLGKLNDLDGDSRHRRSRQPPSFFRRRKAKD